MDKSSCKELLRVSMNTNLVMLRLQIWIVSFPYKTDRGKGFTSALAYDERVSRKELEILPETVCGECCLELDEACIFIRIEGL